MTLAFALVAIVVFVGIVGFSITLGMAAANGDEMASEHDAIDGVFVPPVRRGRG